MYTISKENMTDLTEQKKRERCFRQAAIERHDIKKGQNDLLIWSEADKTWIDSRYMQLCEQENIIPWCLTMGIYVARWAAYNNSKYDVDLITAVIDEMNLSVEEAIEYIEDNYYGEFENLTDYTWYYLKTTGELDSIPKHLERYFDIEAYISNMDFNGQYITVDSPSGNIYVLYYNKTK